MIILFFNKKLAVFIAELIQHLEYEDLNLVIDSYQLFPVDYVEVLSERVLIVYLGYPHLSAEEKLCDIRQHQRKQDLTNLVSDREKITILSQFIQESKIM